MSKLYDVIGESGSANLLADPNGADVIAIPCKPGNGAITRGTLMYRESSGLYSPADNTNVTAANSLVVLNANVNTGAAPKSGGTATAEDAPAFRAGKFIDGAVTLKDGAALSEANKVILRGQNIVFSEKTASGTFKNTVTG